MTEILSPHFTADEFRCRCCGLVNVDPALIVALERLRTAIGVPIVVLCGCRCPRHNKEVGGADKSEHLTTGIRAGTAADIRASGLKLSALYLAAVKVPAFCDGGIGVYPDSGFIHVDVRPEIARWGELQGRRKVGILAALDVLLAKEKGGVA